MSCGQATVKCDRRRGRACLQDSGDAVFAPAECALVEKYDNMVTKWQLA